MLTFIFSDNQSTATKLRHVLEHYGHQCPIANVMSVSRAFESIAELGSHAGAIAVLPSNHQRALEMLTHLRRQVKGWLIAVGEADDAYHLLDIIHAGADDFLDEASDTISQLTAFLERVAERTPVNQDENRLITVTSPSGGSGASFLATNLAVLTAEAEQECGLLDLGAARGDLATLLNLKPRHSLADLCQGLDKLDRKMFEQSLVKHTCGVRLLSAPQRFSELSHVTAEGTRKVLRLARSVFQTTICDAGSLMVVPEKDLIQMSQKVVVIFRLDFTSIRHVRQMLDHWNGEIDTNKVILIANRVGQLGEPPLSRAEGVLQHPIAYSIPNDDGLVNLCLNCGNPLVLESPKSKLSKSLQTVMRLIDDNAPDPALIPPKPVTSNEPFFCWSNLRTAFDFAPRFIRSVG